MPTTPAVLQRQTAIIPFRGGVDLKTAEQVVDPLKLLELENATFMEPGELRKDNGYQLLSSELQTGDAVPAPLNRMIAAGKKQVAFMGGRLLNRIEGADFFSSMATGSSPAAESTVLASTSSETLNTITSGSASYETDYAYCNGYDFFIASVYDGAATTMIRERATGSLLYTSSIGMSGSSSAPRLITIGSFILVVYALDGNLVVRKFDTTDPGSRLQGVVNVATDVGASKLFDVVAGASSFYVAYNQGSNVKVAKVNPSTLTVSASTTLAATPDRALGIGIYPSTEALLVGWCDSSTGMHIAGFTSAPAVVSNTLVDGTATDVKRIGICDADTSANAMVFYENETAAPSDVTYCICPFTGASAGSAVGFKGTRLAHKPFRAGEIVCVGIMRSAGTTAQSTENWYCTAAVRGNSAANADPIAWYLYQVAHAIVGRNTLPGVAYDSAAAEYRWSAQERVDIRQVSDGYGTSGDPSVASAYQVANTVNALRMFDNAHATSQLNTIFAGGWLDDSGPTGGGALNSYAFPFAPVITSIASAAVGGSLNPGEEYEWIAVYEFVMPGGQVVQSIPSAPVSATIGVGHDGVNVSVTTAFLRGNAAINKRVRLYRTKNGLAAPHYASASSVDDGLRSQYVRALNDGAADSDIETNSTLYTDSGVLPNYPAPQGRFITTYQDRIWAIDEHTGEIAFTKEMVPGEVPAWHPNLVVEARSAGIDSCVLVPSAQGLWVLGRDLASGKGAIGIIVGDGPNDVGQGASYSLQRMENANVGPTNYRTTVTIPDGILFEDPSIGIHLLPAGGGTPVPIGDEIEGARSALTLINAVLLEDRREVRFVAANGRILVYHYDQHQWSIRDLESIGAAAIVDSCVWNGLHVLGTNESPPKFYRHSLTSWNDGTTFVPFKAVTAWIRLAEFSGLKRVWEFYLLGEHFDPHALTVKVAYDFDDSDEDTYSFSEADIASVAADGKYELRIGPLRKQLCQAVKITVLDSAAVATSTGQGFGLLGLRMHYGVLQRGSRKPNYAVRA